jgi:hypothetical protein
MGILGEPLTFPPLVVPACTTRRMTVRNLIEELEKCDPTYTVILTDEWTYPLMVCNDHHARVVHLVTKSEPT